MPHVVRGLMCVTRYTVHIWIELISVLQLLFLCVSPPWSGRTNSQTKTELSCRWMPPPWISVLVWRLNSLKIHNNDRVSDPRPAHRISEGQPYKEPPQDELITVVVEKSYTRVLCMEMPQSPLNLYSSKMIILLAYICHFLIKPIE